MYFHRWVLNCENLRATAYAFFKGARYGPINVDEVMRGADTTAAHIATIADQQRTRISEELIEPLENEAVCFCPDMWNDPLRQSSV